MIIENYIYIISISFQICGALLLLLDSVFNGVEKIYSQFNYDRKEITDNSYSTFFNKKEDFVPYLKQLFIERSAFLYLAVGYIIGIWGSVGECNKMIIALFVIIVSIVIIIATHFLSNKISVIQSNKVCNDYEKNYN